MLPDEDAHPELVEALRFGPMLPERYRLDEPGMAERFAACDAASGRRPTRSPRGGS